MEMINLTESIIKYLSISSVLLFIMGLLGFLSIKSLKIQGKAKLYVCTLLVVLPLAYPLKTLFPESVKIPVSMEFKYFQQDNENAAERRSAIASFFSNRPETAVEGKECEAGFIETNTSGSVIEDRLMISMTGLIRNWRLIAIALWGGVFFFFLVRVASTGYKTKRFLRLADSVTNPEILKLLQQCVSETGLHRKPKFLMAEGIFTPMAIGFFNPGVIIPRHLLKPEFREGLRFTLLHELKHLQHHHNWWLLIESIIGAAYFFHPVFHWAKRKIHEELEYICDSHVVHVTKKSVSYADFLLNQIWQHSSGRSHALALPFVSTVSKTTTRIHSILENTRPTPFIHIRNRISVLFILMVFPLFLLLSISPSVQDPDQTLNTLDNRKITLKENTDNKSEPDEQKKRISYLEEPSTRPFDDITSHVEKTALASKTEVFVETPDKLIREEKISEPVQEAKSVSIEAANDGYKSETVEEELTPDTMQAFYVSSIALVNNIISSQTVSDKEEVSDRSILSASLAEKYLGLPVNELSISRINNIKVLDEYTVLFIMRGGDLYLTRLSEPCPGLLYASDFNLVALNGKLSKFDRIQAISHNQVVGTSGMLSGFYPYRYEGNKYEAIKTLKKGLLTSLVTEGAFKEFSSVEG